jgi:hypothetical protein
MCERFYKTVLNEFYRVAFRKKLYHSVDELQVDLDGWTSQQRGATTSRTLVLWQDTDAHLPRRAADDQGENCTELAARTQPDGHAAETNP